MEKEKSQRAKPYATPTLWVYGGIESLTQAMGKAGTTADARGATKDSRTG